MSKNFIYFVVSLIGVLLCVYSSIYHYINSKQGEHKLRIMVSFVWAVILAINGYKYFTEKKK